MKRTSWLNRLRGGRARQRRLSIVRPSARRLLLEPLEDRRMLTTFTVTGPGDDVDEGDDLVTLREAINDANANAGPDIIIFSSEMSGQVIAPGSALPVITDSVVIDATTAPGYAGEPLVTLDGIGAGAAAGLYLLASAPNSEIHGLSVVRFTDGIILESNANLVSRNYVGISPSGGTGVGNAFDGVILDNVSGNLITENVISGNFRHGLVIDSGGSNIVTNNLVGTDATGVTAVGNAQDGVQIFNSSGNLIGGIVDADRNIISGNQQGVTIIGDTAPASNNVVQGNYIGTNVTGQQAIPNLDDGIQLWNVTGASNGAVTGNLIGGDDDDDGALDGIVRARNVISGNTNEGVSLFGSEVMQNNIEGNWIGLTADGQAALPNSIGVNITNPVGESASEAAFSNIIGGTTAGAGNVISGNTKDGIQLGFGTFSNLVFRNFIGTDPSGGADPNASVGLGNKRDGIRVSDATDNLIGGVTDAERNVIAGNLRHGVAIKPGGFDLPTVRNQLVGNYIGVLIDGVTSGGNGGDGVFIENASDTKIGDGSPEGRNVISGNEGSGIEIAGAMATGNEILDNYIGSAFDGLADLGNSKHGVLIRDNASDNMIGDGTGNAEQNSGNVIAFNGIGLGPKGYGVQVESGTGNAIRQNQIFGNKGRGINLDDPNSVYAFHLSDIGERDLDRDGFYDANEDLNGNGILDPTDADEGANQLQNPAVVTNVSFTGGTKTITWTLHSAPGIYAVDVFAAPSEDENGSFIGPHESGFGDAATFLESTFVIVFPSGFGTFTRTFDDVPEQAYISVTVTDTSGNTSELSMVDTDGDAIADAWEVFGVDVNDDGLIDLKFRGVTNRGKQYFADPLHKDIFVEVDALAGFAPTQNTLDIAAYGRAGFTEGFGAAPNQLVQNPDGNDGINLWALLDETDIILGAFTSAFTNDAPQAFFGDLNGNGTTALGEDLNGDGTWDRVPEDLDGDGNLDINEDLNGNGVRDPAEPDADGDGTFDTQDEDTDNDGILDKGNEDFINPGFFDRGDAADEDGLPWLKLIKGNTDPAKKGGFGTVTERREDARTDIEGLAAKALVFRYALFADRFAWYTNAGGKIGTETGSGGIAELDVPATVGPGGPGNDFLVTLGGYWTPGGTAIEQAATFMHELGHTLGLRHGGGDGIRYKPNYNSVMNYSWSFPKGVAPVQASWRLDFSREALDALDENNLDENKGVSGFVLPYGNAVRTMLVKGISTFGSQNTAFNWSRDDADDDGNVRNDTGVQKDLNGEFGAFLRGWEDWSSLQYAFREGYYFAAGAVRPHDDDIATFDDFIEFYSIGDGPGTLGVRNTALQVDEDGGFVWVEVIREGGTGGEVSIDYATSDGTATAGLDYEARSGTLVFGDGEFRKGLAIQVTSDTVDEFSETVIITFSNPTGGAILGELDETVLTIVDQVAQPGIFRLSKVEGILSEDAGSANFVIERDGGSDGAASVTVSTFDGSAVAGNDYTPTTLTFDFADGQTSQAFAVPIINDSIGERDESFFVQLTNVTGGAVISDGSAEVTILDDEAAAASTFIVTNTDDDGAGSLRQAIVDANARPGFDFIDFDIPGTGVHTIRLLTNLPTITDGVWLDGYTQTDASENTLFLGNNAALQIEITRDPSTLAPRLDPVTSGITVEADGVTIRGLVVNGGIHTGILVVGADHFRIEGNFLGPDVTGSRDRSFAFTALGAERRSFAGIDVTNSSDGVIGGATPGARNLVFGPQVDISIKSGQRIQVLGNLLGVQANGERGTFLRTTDPINNLGIFAAGTDHRIGGTAPGEGNIIAHHRRHGVLVSGIGAIGTGVSGTGITVRGNSIHSNGQQPISHGYTDPRYPVASSFKYNDPLDLDHVEGDQQNYPILHAAAATSTGTTVRGTLPSTPSSTFILDFYTNREIDPSGFGEGETLIHSATVNTDDSGNAAFEINVGVVLPRGTIITATATNAAGSTSQFSRRVAVGEELTSVITVNAPDDVDDGIADETHTSLREAIHAANNHAGPDLIQFNLPAGLHVLQLAFDLPALLDDGTTIDATTQPGYAGTPVLELRGTLEFDDVKVIQGTTPTGLMIVSSDNVIRGLAFNTFAQGIFVGGTFDAREARVVSDRNVFESNVIGTNAAGTVARSNLTGISIMNQAFANRVGGAEAGMGNLIAGNLVQIRDAGDDNVIQGNVIGLNAAGTNHLTTKGTGTTRQFPQIGIESAGTNRTVIGGTEPGAGNLISGGSGGTAIRFRGASDPIVQGNLIGTQISGVLSVPTSIGIEIGGSGGHLIGGTDVGAGNVIAATQFGISITSQTDATIQGNFIGTDATGTIAMGTNTAGIFVNHVGANALIGGTDPAAANKIANHKNGIVVRLSDNVSILGNAIYSNSLLGIDLGFDGVTPNDAGDVDTGPNGLQNFPVLGSAPLAGPVLTVNGTLDSTPDTIFRIEFFANAQADPSGHGEGERFLGFRDVTTDGTGAASFNVAFTGLITAGQFITATATLTDPQSGEFTNTSEFSQAIEVVSEACSLEVTTTEDVVDPNDGVNSLREAITCANDTPGPDTITLPAGTYTLTLPGTSEDDNQTGDLDITDSLTITGAGAATTIIDGDSIDRVMHILSSTTVVTLSDITVQNGLTNDIGGGILNEATLNLNDSTVAGNEAVKGGGVYHTGGLTLTATRTTLSGNIAEKGAGFLNNSGDLFFIDSTISGNNADVQGGGGIHTGDSMSLTRTTVSGNTAGTGGGGGIFNRAPLAAINSTLSGNMADGSGGGVSNTGGATLDLLNVTITDNTADFDNDGVGDGGGVFDSTGAFQARNTIVAGNIDQGAEGPDIFGTLNSLGFNLIQDATGVTIQGDATSNILGQDPLLGPLQDNGGSTFTHALLSDSPAIDTADSANFPATDQRGAGRPHGAGPDVGAFEVSVDEAPLTASLSGPTSGFEGSPLTLLGSATGPAGSNDNLTFTWLVAKDGLAFASGSGQDIRFTPDDEGLYQVTLTVSNDDGGVDAVGQTVTVTNVAPTVTAAADQTADRSSPTRFALGSFADPGNDGPWTVQVAWGDGSTGDTFSLASPGELESLFHSYAVADVYMVTVTVSEKNGAGESSSASFEVTVASLEAGHSISGYVYADVNNNGIRDAVEMGLPNVPIALTGSEQRTVLSGPDGHYVFSQLLPGTYHLRETQPLAFLDGIDTLGTPRLGGAENDYFHDVQLSGEATLATGYNFGERGLRPDLVSKQLLLASTLPFGELIRQLDVVGGTGWGTFTANYYATLTLTAESESGEDVTLEVYDQAMLPVSLARGSSLQVGVVEGEGYLIHVSGADSVRFEFTIDQSGTYTNQSMPLDVTADGVISPIDVLMVISTLNGTGARRLSGPNSAAPYYDTNADLVVSPVDVLLVINWLNQGGSIGEGESTGPTQENNHGVSGPMTVAALLNDSTPLPSLHDERNFQTEGLTVAAAKSNHATATAAPAMTFSRPSDRHELSATRAPQRARFGSGLFFFADGFHAIQSGDDHTHRGQGSSESFGGSGVPVRLGEYVGTQRVGDTSSSHIVMSDQVFGSHQYQSGTDTAKLVAGPLDNEALYETIAIDLLEGRHSRRPDPGLGYAAVDILLLEDDWLD